MLQLYLVFNKFLSTPIVWGYKRNYWKPIVSMR